MKAAPLSKAPAPSRLSPAVMWLLLAALAAGLTGCQSVPHARTGWRDALARELPRLGHRNWILVADSAYPAQTAPGVEVVWTGAPMAEVLPVVLEQVRQAPHVRGVPFLDAELAKVSEADAPGAEVCRRFLREQLAGWTVQTRPHEELIRELGEAAREFKVLVLKTTETVPYSSVFIRLDCGYWSDEAEARLRERLATGP